MNKKITVELNCLDFLLDLLGWTSPLCRKAFMAEISQFQDCAVNFLKVSDKDALLVRFALNPLLCTSSSCFDSVKEKLQIDG